MEQQLQQLDYEAQVDQEFNEQCLESHNHYRSLHGCPPLSLSDSLAASAQRWADNLASIGYLKHSPNASGNFGENVAMKMTMGNQEYKGSQATSQWYSEIEFYDFSGVENQTRCGHFSQVVWKGTKEAGFGKAVSPDGKMFAVGQYSPPGNFMNKWVENIPPPLSGKCDVPTQEDIMGQQQQQQQQPQKIITKRSGGRHGNQMNTNGSLLSASSAQEPEPHDQRDRQVGKATKTKIVNGEKTVTITMTFMRSDGSRYQVSKETSTPIESGGSSMSIKSRRSGDVEEFIPMMRMRRNFAAPPSGGSANEEFQDELLELHNELRRRHGVPQLQRSDSLTDLADEWARNLSRSRELSHRRDCQHQGGLIGQNIAKKPADSSEPSQTLSPAAQLAYQWYGEGRNFQFGQEQPNDIKGGHFTQMVWQATRKMGVGRAVDPDTGDIYVACFYHPCGNIEGQFSSNVPPAE